MLFLFIMMLLEKTGIWESGFIGYLFKSFLSKPLFFCMFILNPIAALIWVGILFESLIKREKVSILKLTFALGLTAGTVFMVLSLFSLH